MGGGGVPLLNSFWTCSNISAQWYHNKAQNIFVRLYQIKLLRCPFQVDSRHNAGKK